MNASLFHTIRARIRQRSFLARLVSLALAVLVFGFLGFRAFQAIRQLDGTQLSFSPGYLLLSFLCQSVGVMLAAWIWSDILSHLGLRSRYLFDLETFTATALARKIPGTLWYAVGRVAIYSARGLSKSRVILAIAVESVMIALGGLVNLAASVGSNFFAIPGLEGPLFSPQVTAFVIIPAVLVLSSILSPILIRSVLRRTQPKDGQPEAPAEPLQVSFWDTLRWVAGETVVVILATGVGFFFMKSIDSTSPAPFTAMLGAVSLSTTIGPLAMWLPGDIGLKDGFLYLALSPWISSSFAALVTLTWRIWLSFLEIGMGLAGWLALQKQIRILKES